jgi:hypothetical protein
MPSSLANRISVTARKFKFGGGEMKRSSLIVLLAITIPTLSGCDSGTFTIKSDKFKASDICDGTGTYVIYMNNNDVCVKTPGKILAFMRKSGFPSSWCHGFVHQFEGVVKRSGYTFESDANDPLKFMVDRNKGYYYISGNGIVTDPDGKVTTLPKKYKMRNE